ncbi:MAG: DUF2167 domain-containing protein [Luteolibacter sp.]
MKKRLISSLLMLVLGFAAIPAFADQDPPADSKPGGKGGISEKDRQWLQNLKFETGTVMINTVAEAKIPEGYRYLNPVDSSRYLQLLGNPPSRVEGILFPKDADWFVVLEYEKEGHVKDDDAKKINYADLLKDMKESTKDGNAQRTSQGYPAIELVGWATPPHYDASTHKLYWAQDLKFSDAPGHTLNYNIRMLGREGVLVANAVGEVGELPDIEKATPDILAMVDFTAGNRYQDYNEKTDHTAEYGIAGLIAGAAGLKIAAKLGIFALLAKKAAVLWKPIAIVFAAIATRFKKLFGRKGDASA